MADAPSPKRILQPPRLTPAKVADLVWIEARRLYVKTLNQEPSQFDQPVYIRFLASVDDARREVSWKDGLNALPTSSLRAFNFDLLRPLLSKRLEAEIMQLT